MERTVPIKLVKIVRDANDIMESIEEMRDKRSDMLRIKEKDLPLSEEQKEILKKYDIDMLGKHITELEKADKIFALFGETVEKQDRSLVLTEIINRGFFKKNSIKSIFPLEVFAYDVICPSCGEKDAKTHYSKNQNTGDVVYKKCLSCGHESHNMCNCSKCIERWMEFKNKLYEFIPFFSDGFLLIHVSNYAFNRKDNQSISNQEDLDIFYELLKSSNLFFGNLKYSTLDD